MRDVNLVIIVAKVHLKLQRVIVATALFLHRVLVVSDVIAIAVPADAARARSFLTRVEERLLPRIVGTVRLHEVDDIESVLGVAAHI